jgi:BTB/POZ domain-containing protein 17
VRFKLFNFLHFTDQNVPWEIDFFPRGIRYHKAKLINIYNQQGSTEIPESILRTVRLRVTYRENIDYEQRFKIGVLITGVQNTIAHIKTVHVKSHYFSSASRVLNLDNLLPFDELALSALSLSPHLIGSKRNTLCIQIVIAPMGPFVCPDEPSFELK